WWITGVMPDRNWSAGQRLTISGKAKIYSKEIAADLSKVKLSGGMNLEHIVDADGIEREGVMQFASSFMTPTGFPIERSDGDMVVGSGTVTNMKMVDGHIEGDFSAPIQIPATMPAGYFRLNFNGALTGLDPAARYFDVPPTPEGEGRINTVALVRVGNPVSPRFFWLLALDTLSNGARGTVAIEDRGKVGITSHVATNPPQLVVPMRDPRSGAIFRYDLEPYVPLVERTFARIGTPPRIAFKFPSGSLSVRVIRP